MFRKDERIVFFRIGTVGLKKGAACWNLPQTEPAATVLARPIALSPDEKPTSVSSHQPHSDKYADSRWTSVIEGDGHLGVARMVGNSEARQTMGPDKCLKPMRQSYNGSSSAAIGFSGEFRTDRLDSVDARLFMCSLDSLASLRFYIAKDGCSL